MGYLGLSCICDTDVGADFVASLADVIEPKLRRHMKVKENAYNTDGIINVGLFLEEIVGTYLFGSMDEFILEEFVPAFEQFIKESDNKEWETSKNKQFHINAYKRMLKNIKRNL